MWPSLEGRRFAVQIFGREPEALARAAGMAVDVGASIVDINMGCPAKKVTAGAVRLGAHARAGAGGRAGRGRAARGAGADPGDGQAPRRLGRDEPQRRRVRAAPGRGGRRDDHRPRPHARAGLLGRRPDGADRRRARRAAARDPRRRQRRREGPGRLHAHEGRDRLRRRDDRPRRDGEPLVLPLARRAGDGRGRIRARRRWPSAAASGAATPIWSSSTAPRRCACTSCARRWPGTRAASTAARRCASGRLPSTIRRRCSRWARRSSPTSRRPRRPGTPRPLLAPADPVAKSMARHGRRGGRPRGGRRDVASRLPELSALAASLAGRVRGRLARRHRRRDQHPRAPQRPAGAARHRAARRLQARRHPPDRDGAAHRGPARPAAPHRRAGPHRRRRGGADPAPRRALRRHARGAQRRRGGADALGRRQATPAPTARAPRWPRSPAAARPARGRCSTATAACPACRRPSARPIRSALGRRPDVDRSALAQGGRRPEIIPEFAATSPMVEPRRGRSFSWPSAPISL